MTASTTFRPPFLTAFVLALGAARALPAQNANGAKGPLASRIDAIIAKEPFRRAQWGIAVLDVRTGDLLYARNADEPMIPASTLKLVIAAAAASTLDPTFRYTTTLLATGPVQGGELRGDLIIRGTGDPTISGRYHEDRMTAVLEALADSLSARGVRKISGRIVVDQSHWDQEYVHEDWEAYDALWWYAAPVAPLGFNDNSIDFRVEPGRAGQPARITWQPQTRYFVFRNTTRTVAAGTPKTLDFKRGEGTDTIVAYGEIPVNAEPRTEYFAVTDPGRYTATVFGEVLEARGIEVANDDVEITRTADSGATTLTLYRSPPLDSIIAPILQRSQNWFAEQLLKTVAREKAGEGTWDAGLAIERKFLIDVIGFSESDFVLRDASGLSTQNRITPAGLAKLVRYIHNTPALAMVRDALPVSGAETGSLRTRLADLRGRVHAKTGSVRDVASLAGFVSNANGRDLAFVIIANDTGVSATKSSEAIDDIVRVIAAQN
ncbi:MAG: D-alanyl-D-alanine carboxypeptidase/D-alanyl-D-alanine endopeptidase [Longimicrobiales bacterium]